MMRAMSVLALATCVSAQQTQADKIRELEAQIVTLQEKLDKAEKYAASCSPTSSPSEHFECYMISPGAQAYKDSNPEWAWEHNQRVGPPPPPGTANTINPDKWIGVTCCNDETCTGRACGSRTGCAGQTAGANWDEAAAHCHSMGKVLCSIEQMRSEAGQGDGCNFDAYHVWTRTGAQCPRPTEAPRTGTPKAQARGDPFVVNTDGSKTQLWLELRNNAKGIPTSAQDNLLECPTFTLYGRAMGTGIKNDHQQWFSEFRIVAHDKEQVRVGIRTGPNATDPKVLNVLDLTVEGEKVGRTGSAAASGGLVSVWKDEEDQGVENVQFSAGATSVIRIQSAVAQKFVDAREQRKYTHLDITFVELTKQDCTGGTLAEIWGVVPMTQETAKKLEPHYIIDG